MKECVGNHMNRFVLLASVFVTCLLLFMHELYHAVNHALSV
jgi:hypothetical protein